ncbi:hypothetical protein PsYK624_013280 [Phanerochaete sordida]|uniref:Uncharacterized protein n=1 Tax=Phanerochaete sordida TaxID=48140 RepID=A0A9P3FZL8_9APHY|nr:hypothetical protein PsYK624_013280 [Phanerochaete sordida]
MQPLSLQRGSPSPIPAPSTTPSFKLSSPRVDSARPGSGATDAPHASVEPDVLQTIVHIAMPRPARSRESSREGAHDLPEGLTFGVLRHS